MRKIKSLFLGMGPYKYSLPFLILGLVVMPLFLMFTTSVQYENVEVAHAAGERVQTVVGNNVAGGTTVAATWPDATIADHLLIAIIGFEQGNAVTVTPPAGLGWTLAVRKDKATKVGIAIYYIENAAPQSGASTWTITSTTATLILAEYSGMVTLGALDMTASASGKKIKVDSGLTAITTQKDEIAIAGIASLSTASNNTSGQTTGWDEVSEVQSSGENAVFYEIILSTTGTQQVTANQLTNDFFAGAIATFKFVLGREVLERESLMELRKSRIVISGRAYSDREVTLLIDGQISDTTVAHNDGDFKFKVGGLSSGPFIFSVFAEDINQVRSSVVTLPTTFISSSEIEIRGVVIPPTIRADKLQVSSGNSVTISGQSSPNSEVVIKITNPDGQEFFHIENVDRRDFYTFELTTNSLPKGRYLISARSAIEGSSSTFSNTLSFTIGVKDVIRQTETGCSFYGDLNGDCRVNLIDFSIASFWFGRPLTSDIAAKEIERINGDGKFDLIDFSIIAFYWTG